MAWKKIDDAQTQSDMPYSSFLATGLTNNANGYNDALTRGGGIAWNGHDKVTWSSYHQAQGVMFTANVGQQVLQVDFRVSYQTLTGSVDADDFQGLLTLLHLGGTERVTVGVRPSAGTTGYLDISLPMLAPTTGPQAFALLFKSSKLENKGIVDVQGGVENTIYLDQRAGAGHYDITAGEKHELLSLVEPGHDVGTTGPSEQSTIEYQINYINTSAAHPPDAYASVYPSVTANSPRLSPTYSSAKIGAGTVFELGAFTLMGVAFNSVSANPGNAPAQFSHNSTVALAQVIYAQNVARVQLQPDLCNGVSQRFALGAVVAANSVFPAAAAVTTGFSFVTNAVVDYKTLSVSLRCFALNATTRQTMFLTLYDDAGNPVVPKQEKYVLAATTRTPQSVIGITARGWYDPTAAAKWGMRDSMPEGEMQAATTVTFNLDDLYLDAFRVYTVVIGADPAQSAFYVFDLYARITNRASQP